MDSAPLSTPTVQSPNLPESDDDVPCIPEPTLQAGPFSESIHPDLKSTDKMQAENLFVHKPTNIVICKSDFVTMEYSSLERHLRTNHSLKGPELSIICEDARKLLGNEGQFRVETFYDFIATLPLYGPFPILPVKKGFKCSLCANPPAIHESEKNLRAHFQVKHSGMEGNWSEVVYQTLYIPGRGGARFNVESRGTPPPQEVTCGRGHIQSIADEIFKNTFQKA